LRKGHSSCLFLFKSFLLGLDVPIDRLPKMGIQLHTADMVQTIEVNKVVTSDMDGEYAS